MSGMSVYFYLMKSLSTASAHVNVFDFENDPSGKAFIALCSQACNTKYSPRSKFIFKLISGYCNLLFTNFLLKWWYSVAVFVWLLLFGQH